MQQSQSTTTNNRRRRKPSSAVSVVDDPCWGSSENCSLPDLLTKIDKSTAILHECDDYIALHKPPDLRMDGNYPATVHKLLTYWYPPVSLQKEKDLFKTVASHHTFNSISDNVLRPCHQLDYATSGVLLVARNHEAASKACAAFADRTTKKTYFAILHRHVERLTGKSLETPSANDDDTSTFLTLEQLTQRLVAEEQAELQQRSRRRQDTFCGFQPPHSIFLKWKGKQKPPSSNHDSALKKKKKRRRKDPDFPHVWEQVATKLTPAEQQHLAKMSWNDIKENAEWKQIFVDASTIYNEALQSYRKEQTQHEEGTQKSELPALFSLNQDKDDTIYIHAALTQQPDSFAMKIHPGALAEVQQQRQRQQRPQQQKVVTEEDSALSFKNALTRCTILQKGTFRGMPVTKVRLEPLTGRRHQLRCHTALLGHPILGDVTYETTDHDCSRMCLHAQQLCLPNLLNASADDPFNFDKNGELLL